MEKYGPFGPLNKRTLKELHKIAGKPEAQFIVELLQCAPPVVKNGGFTARYIDMVATAAPRLAPDYKYLFTISIVTRIDYIAR